LSPDASAPALQDARGCLTPRGFAALERAPPGAAPAELAGHLAGCGHCQQRWLATLSAGRTAKRRSPGSMWRNLLFLVGALFLLLTGLFMMVRLR
jgi:hypothetical protein